MNILVTGATGVVGRRAVPLLAAAGHRVTAIGRSAEKLAALERPGVTTSRVDLFDPEALRGAVAGCDAVLNLATHIPQTTARTFLPGAWAENDRIRRIGSANLVDAALSANVRRFVQESFAPAYPDRGDQWIGEETPLEPVGYNRTIEDAEASAARFTERSRGAGVVLRFGAFYGPDSRFVLDMIRIVRRGWVPLPGAPESYLSPISHDDAATAAVAALEVGAGTYNAADDQPVTRREYFDTLAAALGVPPPRFPPQWTARLLGSAGEFLSRSQRISNRKLKSQSGWAPKYPSVREGWRAVVPAMEKDGQTAAA
jgi:nucleoside-diphosphate-sugar epimerase